MERTILHSDMNNFYASVECLYDPSLRGKPVAVAGDSTLRHGIVLAKNEAAKRFGVQTGEALWQARRKCGELVFVPPHYDRYLRYSRMARDIYAEYTDRVESFGLDECWLDVSDSRALFGDGTAIADQIRRRIREELGVTASVGVSFNKIFAKLGSDLRKPDATTVISREHFQDQVWPLPVRELLYVGRATHAALAKYGIHTIGQLAQADARFLQRILGKNGVMLWTFANGRDLSPVSNIGAKSMVKSVGNSTTAPRDLTTGQDVKITLYVLCESVSARLRACDFVCGTVQLHVRDNQLCSYERQAKLSLPSSNTRDLFVKAWELYEKNPPGRPIRSLGVRACGLAVEENPQLSFLPELEQMQEQDRLERTVDRLRERFGHGCVRRGIMLLDPALSAVDPQNDHVIHPEGMGKSLALADSRLQKPQ